MHSTAADPDRAAEESACIEAPLAAGPESAGVEFAPDSSPPSKCAAMAGRPSASKAAPAGERASVRYGTSTSLAWADGATRTSALEQPSQSATPRAEECSQVSATQALRHITARPPARGC